jgi:hypothetical protein
MSKKKYFLGDNVVRERWAREYEEELRKWKHTKQRHDLSAGARRAIGKLRQIKVTPMGTVIINPRYMWLWKASPTPDDVVDMILEEWQGEGCPPSFPVEGKEGKSHARKQLLLAHELGFIWFLQNPDPDFIPAYTQSEMREARLDLSRHYPQKWQRDNFKAAGRPPIEFKPWKKSGSASPSKWKPLRVRAISPCPPPIPKRPTRPPKVQTQHERSAEMMNYEESGKARGSKTNKRSARKGVRRMFAGDFDANYMQHPKDVLHVKVTKIEPAWDYAYLGKDEWLRGYHGVEDKGWGKKVPAGNLVPPTHPWVNDLWFYRKSPETGLQGEPQFILFGPGASGQVGGRAGIQAQHASIFDTPREAEEWVRDTAEKISMEAMGGPLESTEIPPVKKWKDGAVKNAKGLPWIVPSELKRLLPTAAWKRTHKKPQKGETYVNPRSGRMRRRNSIPGWNMTPMGKKVRGVRIIRDGGGGRYGYGGGGGGCDEPPTWRLTVEGTPKGKIGTLIRDKWSWAVFQAEPLRADSWAEVRWKKLESGKADGVNNAIYAAEDAQAALAGGTRGARTNPALALPPRGWRTGRRYAQVADQMGLLPEYRDSPEAIAWAWRFHESGRPLGEAADEWGEYLTRKFHNPCGSRGARTNPTKPDQVRTLGRDGKDGRALVEFAVSDEWNYEWETTVDPKGFYVAMYHIDGGDPRKPYRQSDSQIPLRTLEAARETIQQSIQVNALDDYHNLEMSWDEYLDTLCSSCGAPADDGEGWDGECGNCADITSQEEDDDDDWLENPCGAGGAPPSKKRNPVSEYSARAAGRPDLVEGGRRDKKLDDWWWDFDTRLAFYNLTDEARRIAFDSRKDWDSPFPEFTTNREKLFSDPNVLLAVRRAYDAGKTPLQTLESLQRSGLLYKKPRRKNPKKSPTWVALGSDVVFVLEDGHEHALGEDWVLATQPGMKSLFLVRQGEPASKNPSPGATRAYKRWTAGDEPRGVSSAGRPDGKRVGRLGRIKEVLYTGPLGGNPPKAYRHEFKGTTPVLTEVTDGLIIDRSGSSYRVTSRGIVG